MLCAKSWLKLIQRFWKRSRKLSSPKPHCYCLSIKFKRDVSNVPITCQKGKYSGFYFFQNNFPFCLTKESNSCIKKKCSSDSCTYMYLLIMINYLNNMFRVFLRLWKTFPLILKKLFGYNSIYWCNNVFNCKTCYAIIIQNIKEIQK